MFFKKYYKYIGQYKKQTFLSPFFLMFETAIEVTIPLIMAFMIDDGISKSDTKVLFISGFALIMMALLGLLFGTQSARNASIASCGFSKNIGEAMFYKIQNFSFKNIDKYSSSSLVTRLTYDVKNMENAFRMIIRTLFRSPILFVFSVTMTFILNAKLALIFLIAAPALAVGLGFIIFKAFPLFQKMFVQYDKVEAKVQENLTGIRVVKSFVQEDREIAEFEKEATTLKNLSKSAEKIVALNVPLMSVVMNGCILAILWLGGNLIVLEQFSAGKMLSFINYAMQMIMSLMMLSMVMVNIVISKASANRINEVLNEEIDLKDNGTISSPPQNGEVEFKDVYFNYERKTTNFVLTDINLKIKSGEKVGIVGGTGASKSSLLQLIPRLYDVEVGEIKVGGRNVKDYKLQPLRDSVAMVLQKNVLFSGTIKDNLKWGNIEATDEEIENACKIAMAHNFIKNFADGYSTVLGQGGVNLSGGQKQRICIARALLKNPKIIILDDSTSAVDIATENNLWKNFRKSFKDITVLIVAQRINSVIDCDRIIVLDEGKINGIGSHSELLKTKGSEALPITLLDGKIVKSGSYPSKKELAEWLKIEVSELSSAIITKKQKCCSENEPCDCNNEKEEPCCSNDKVEQCCGDKKGCC